MVECPSIPGCVSQGETVEEAMANILDAIEGCLAVLKEAGEALPAPTDAMFASVEVAA